MVLPARRAGAPLEGERGERTADHLWQPLQADVRAVPNGERKPVIWSDVRPARSYRVTELFDFHLPRFCTS